jgi:putative ABC transport system permease protein
MLYHHLLLSIRHLSRNRRYLLINVLGLGAALGFAILAYLNHQFSTTFDSWHRDADRIVRAEIIKESNKEAYGYCPSALGPVAAANISAIEAQCRLDSRSTVVKRDDAVFNENLHFTDENFFEFFNFTLLKGRIDLADRNSVVLEEEAALKYFGTDDPLGKTLLFYADTEQRLPLTVSGVVKKLPLNSSIRFSFMTHLDNQFEGAARVDYTGWKWVVDALFFKLKNAADAPALAASLQPYVEPCNIARPNAQITGYRIERLRELALTSRELRANSLWPGMPPGSIWGTIIMASLLLLTASLNFANMTIAICNRRLREMGVRKVMGGTRTQLMVQLLGDSLVVVALAAAMGMMLAFPIVTWFNTTWKFTDLRVNYSDPYLLAYIGAAVAGTTLLAGSYPALYISSFRPSHIFRGGVLFGHSSLFSRMMMGLQVSISLVAVVTGLSFARNAESNRNADVGFAYQPVLQAWLPSAQDFSRFNDAVRNLPGVEATTGSADLPGFGYGLVDFAWQSTTQEALLYQISSDFPEFMQMRLVEGVWAAPAGDTTASAEVVVNETMARELGGTVIGQTLSFRKRTVRISGVVADFMTRTPFNPIQPAMLNPVPMGQWRRCLIKTADTDGQPKAMAALETEWKRLFPYSPVNIGYQRDMLRDAIEASDNIAMSMAVFAGVAILLSITGLFSLVSLNVLRRLREVAIRRVLGASVSEVAWILNKSYTWVFVLAIVSGCAGGYFFSMTLLDSVFKINFGVPVAALVWGSIGVLTVAAATIGLKLWQTLQINPSEVLRGE